MAAKRGGRTQAKRGGGAKSGLLLVGIGLLVGLGLAAAYLVYGDRQTLDALLPQPNPRAEAPTPSREREPLAQEPVPASGPSSEPDKPTFDFYTVLPEKEVALPSAPAASPAAGAGLASPTAPAPSAGTDADATRRPATGGLLLQAGAFSSAADAEALRARLALLGQTARIEVAESNGRTVHRVRLGPFATPAERAAAQARLAEAGISAAPAR